MAKREQHDEEVRKEVMKSVQGRTAKGKKPSNNAIKQAMRENEKRMSGKKARKQVRDIADGGVDTGMFSS